MKIGCDPELFVQRNGQVISAHGMIPGTKEEPFKVTDGAVQVDGTAVEFNINPVESCRDFEHHIKSVMSDLKDLIKQDHPDNEFLIASSVEYPKEYFESIPLDARELGCDPDFDAYELIQRRLPDIAGVTRMRTGAGHVHTGWGDDLNPEDEDHWVNCVKATRVLDVVLNPFLETIEDNLKRRELYGLPGTFRPKSYGSEYRTPSNQYLKSVEYIREVYDRTVRGVQLLIDNDWDLDKTMDTANG